MSSDTPRTDAAIRKEALEEAAKFISEPLHHAQPSAYFANQIRTILIAELDQPKEG